ncbi:conserved hypothetical protein [Gluconacetobacter diazotrophicus PA1 5]|uniref:Lipoprotein n=3 Tax=Gluconacetobacter diazotrophicus TaxID=33996 RepID=A0A7W4I5W0_GLUDI|nr:conserved hypothetical protein [Gluconacetobacter diazotrophicus PA1 5]MBB2156828.1 hypothetical protein [Gluconacetobacter diazotrophicus]TWB04830.1 hypothetical protein FBZ86_11952 [Gluconacetobacter diazotrophicus]CAP57589.1 putative membrane protein [Gluconacetobacter diazotrophicus PA1 5]
MAPAGSEYAAMRRSCLVCLVLIAVLAGCASHPSPPPAARGRDAFHQFDPPAPGVANRPAIGLGGAY